MHPSTRVPAADVAASQRTVAAVAADRGHGRESRRPDTALGLGSPMLDLTPTPRQRLLRERRRGDSLPAPFCTVSGGPTESGP